MQEAGLIDRLRQKYWPTNMCGANPTTSSVNVSMELTDILATFVVCAAAMLAGTLAFMAERFWVRKRRKEDTNIPEITLRGMSKGQDPTPIE